MAGRKRWPSRLGSGAARRIRQSLRQLKWRPQFRRLERLRGIGRGRRAFLVGSGPSLAAMDLSRLGGEFVCVVNMGVRAVGDRLSHADMHVVTDANRYRRFAAEIEAIALDHPIPYRFVSRRARDAWHDLPTKANEPIFVVPHTAKLTGRKGLPPVADGLVTGPSVLVSAAVLLEFMEFSPIYVIGCDLDYDGAGGKYFYEMGKLDLVHESDPIVVGRRTGLAAVNDHFAVLREIFAERGRSLVNAGVGGQLTALPRVDFDSLFEE